MGEFPHFKSGSRPGLIAFKQESKKVMFSHFRSVSLLIASAVVASRLPAQDIGPAKVAIISLQQAVGETQEIKKAVAAMEAKYSPRQKTIEALQKELQDIQKQLSTPGITPAKEAELRSEGTVKQKQLQRLGDDLQADVNADRQDILGKSGRQMAEVVKKLAEEKGVDVVIEVSNTLYFKPALDLTKAATAAYDKAYPAK
jgi:outer membrane protein